MDGWLDGWLCQGGLLVLLPLPPLLLLLLLLALLLPTQLTQS